MEEEWGEKFLIEEYKALWDYYKRTVDERHKLLDYYYKIVPIPAALIGTLATLDLSKISSVAITPERALQVAGAGLAVVFMVGVVAYTTYAKETANSFRYIVAINKIREKFRDHYPSLKDHLIIHIIKTPMDRWGSIPFWRGLILVVLNSAIGVAAMGFLAQGIGQRAAVATFLALACTQGILGRVIMRWPNTVEIDDRPPSGQRH
jgi:hypothetical protein